MDNLLFYALVVALLWYFFYYLPSQKKNFGPDLSKPSFKTQSVQTEALTTPGSYPFSESEKELEQTLDFLIKELKEIDKSLD